MPKYKIIVVGIGPGASEYVLPRAMDTIKKATVIVGGKRALKDFAGHAEHTFAIGADIPAVIEFIRAQSDNSDVVVLVSGDPGYFSLLDRLRLEFPVDRLEVIAGISSIQFAFAKTALPWHEARLVSFHGRMPSKESLVPDDNAILGMLTDGKYNSKTIGQILLDSGWRANAKMYICTRLSYADENILATTIAEAIESEPIGHGVIIVQNNVSL